MQDKQGAPLRAPVKGSNQVTVRGHNERLVLHLVRQHGRLTRAEATRATGLSANAVSVIFRALEADGLLLRDHPIRGRVGQPSVPWRLNPKARHYVGLKIGRRSYDMVVIDFAGTVRARRGARHAYPTPAAMVAFVRANLTPLLRRAGLRRRDVAAMGVAMPSELWHWTAEFDAPPAAMAEWRDIDVAAALGAVLPVPVTVENDATAACRAEWVLGPQPPGRDVVYFFIGTFIGGGIVLDGRVYPGRRGTAGGFGPLRVPDEPGGQRLVDHASLVVPERLAAARGLGWPADPDAADGWGALSPVLADWRPRAARSLAHAIVSTLAVIDFEAVVIDGAVPPTLRTALCADTDAALAGLDLQGVARPPIRAGHFGAAARAVGAASHAIARDHMLEHAPL